MDEFLRRCRGVLGTGVTWGVAWGAIFAAIFVAIAILDPDSIDPGEGPLMGIGIGAFFGFVSGVGTGVLLSLAERGKSIRDLSLARTAVWGALATAVFPLLTPVDNSELLIVCPIGGALAAAMVAAAKRAEIGASAEPPRLPG